MTGDEARALDALRLAQKALAVAEKACIEAGFGGAFVLGPLRESCEGVDAVVAVVADGVPA